MAPKLSRKPTSSCLGRTSDLFFIIHLDYLDIAKIKAPKKYCLKKARIPFNAPDFFLLSGPNQLNIPAYSLILLPGNIFTVYESNF